MERDACRWATRIAIDDYEFSLSWPIGTIRDTRNERIYIVPPSIMDVLLSRYGTQLTSHQIVDHCIATALIPHPYDELV